MRKGFGGGPWGGVPWGGASQDDEEQESFVSGLYPVPLGVDFGSVPITSFTGEPTTGPLSGFAGLLFFSPSLQTPKAGNSLDLASISATVVASDTYSRPQEVSGRVFRFGGSLGAANLSRTNSDLYRTQPKEYNAVATLIQTIPPGPTTIIKIW